ncbi:MAG: hypothetical protein M3Z25_00285 [Actinomycetota bacterium]|nr:hypothetical protein [Actinomycetota bacterium]
MASTGSTITDEQRLEVTLAELEFQRYFAAELRETCVERTDVPLIGRRWSF